MRMQSTGRAQAEHKQGANKVRVPEYAWPRDLDEAAMLAGLDEVPRVGDTYVPLKGEGMPPPASTASPPGRRVVGCRGKGRPNGG